MYDSLSNQVLGARACREAWEARRKAWRGHVARRPRGQGGRGKGGEGGGGGQKNKKIQKTDFCFFVAPPLPPPCTRASHTG